MLRLVIKMAFICLKMIFIAMFGFLSKSYFIKSLSSVRDELLDLVYCVACELGKRSPF